MCDPYENQPSVDQPHLAQGLFFLKNNLWYAYYMFITCSMLIDDKLLYVELYTDFQHEKPCGRKKKSNLYLWYFFKKHDLFDKDT